MKLSIDPSVNNVGICLFNPESKEYNWTLYHPRKGFTLTEKLTSIEKYLEWWLETVHNVVAFGDITEVVCEYPQFFNSEKGAAAATMGFTLDLACICGYMAGICKFAKVYYYTPIKWKGNLTKHAMEFRFKRAFPGISLPSEHEMEATLLMKYHNEQ